jgi:hypothetical protein
MVGLLRRTRIVPQPKVSRDEAQRLARAEVDRQGWQWREPVHVSEWFTYWHFMTNTNYRGGNVVIFIDSETGRVRKANVLPR